MYYIEQENDELVKYEVIINKEELDNIKYEVIQNCGEITHHCFKSDYAPRDLDFYHIFNYSYTYVGQKEYFEETRDVYQYEYDEHSDTRLVTLIDQLLEGDLSILPELKNPGKQEEKTDTIGEEIKKKLEQLLLLDTKEISTWQLEKVKKELEKYQTNEKLNRDRLSDLGYYPQVLACIDMKEVSRKTLDELIKIEELMNQVNFLLQQIKPFFQEIDKQNVCTNQYKKVISKIYSK